MKDTVLKDAVEKAGGVRSVAGAIGISPQALYRILKGTFNPSDALLDHLKLERVVTYRPRKKK